MTQSATRGFLKELDGNTIGIKKLFYILRPLLAADWCVSRLEIAPMRFPLLATLLPRSLRAEVDEIIRVKATRPESAPIELGNALLDFILTRFDILQSQAGTLQNPLFGIDPLNRFFLQSLTDNDYSGT